MDSTIFPSSINDEYGQAVENQLNTMGSIVLNNLIPMDIDNADETILPYIAKYIGCRWIKYVEGVSAQRAILKIWIPYYLEYVGTHEGYKRFAALTNAIVVNIFTPYQTFAPLVNFWGEYINIRPYSAVIDLRIPGQTIDRKINPVCVGYPAYHFATDDTNTTKTLYALNLCKRKVDKILINTRLTEHFVDIVIT